MRTTLTIDDDVMSTVKEMAARQQKSLGEVISALIRQALLSTKPADGERNGIPLLPVRPGAAPVTLELVNQLRDDYNSLMETGHLLASPVNAAHLADSIAQLRGGQVTQHHLIEVDE